MLLCAPLPCKEFSCLHNGHAAHVPTCTLRNPRLFKNSSKPRS